jgi:hypothetical protein
VCVVLRKKDLEEVHHSDPGHDHEVFRRPELIGKAGNPEFVQNLQDQATGKARIELDMLIAGKDPYFGLLDPLDFNKRGTKQDPIIVVSPDSDRFVGCNGITYLSTTTPYLDGRFY